VSYVPHTDGDRVAMLRAIGVERIADLFAQLPPEVLLRRPLSLPEALDEPALIRHLRELSRRNTSGEEAVSFLGAGIYDHFVPAVVGALVSRGEFLTAYTPYQPEMSQGMLQAMYEFQSLICALTGMDIANASMYDAATAMAEACLMLVEATGRRRVAVSRAVHPHYREVLRTYFCAADVEYCEAPCADGRTATDPLTQALEAPTACVAVQNPNFLGVVEDLPALRQCAAEAGARAIVAVDPVSLGLLKPPGAVGFDVVVGEGQALGSPTAFGGPLLGFFACRSEFQRKFPGRIVGRTQDAAGRRGFTMTLRTREQDIRREKATSNICTNEALLALAASIDLCALGPSGLRGLAELSLQKAHYARDVLCAVPGVAQVFGHPFLKEFVIRLDTRRSVHDVSRALLGAGILAGYPLGEAYPELHDALLVCVTEKRTKAEVDQYAQALRVAMEGGAA